MIHSSSDYVMWCDVMWFMWFRKYFEIISKKIWFIQVGYSSMIYMIHSSSHLIYVIFRFRSFPSTRLIIFVLFFTDIVSWWLLLEVPTSMILTTSAMPAESFWMSSQSGTPPSKGTTFVRLTRRTLEFKWGTRTRVGRPTWFVEAVGSLWSRGTERRNKNWNLACQENGRKQQITQTTATFVWW